RVLPVALLAALRDRVLLVLRRIVERARLGLGRALLPVLAALPGVRVAFILAHLVVGAGHVARIVGFVFTHRKSPWKGAGPGGELAGPVTRLTRRARPRFR